MLRLTAIHSSCDDYFGVYDRMSNESIPCCQALNAYVIGHLIAGNEPKLAMVAAEKMIKWTAENDPDYDMLKVLGIRATVLLIDTLSAGAGTGVADVESALGVVQWFELDSLLRNLQEGDVDLVARLMLRGKQTMLLAGGGVLDALSAHRHNNKHEQICSKTCIGKQNIAKTKRVKAYSITFAALRTGRCLV